MLYKGKNKCPIVVGGVYTFVYHERLSVFRVMDIIDDSINYFYLEDRIAKNHSFTNSMPFLEKVEVTPHGFKMYYNALQGR